MNRFKRDNPERKDGVNIFKWRAQCTAING